MTGGEKRSLLKTKVEQAESYRPARPKSDGDEDGEMEEEEEEEAYAGPTALVHVKEAQSAWEAMRSRLGESPVIQEILKGSRRATRAIGETPVGQKAADAAGNVKDRIDDAREVWETSQNPLVVYASGAWENLTGETEEGLAIADFRKLDPGFVKEEWCAEVKAELAPVLVKAHLTGDTRTLKKWMGEACYNKLAADIRARKADGLVLDDNILDLDENDCVIRFLESGGPIVVNVYTVQQIHCVRNKKGEVVDGSESDVRAKFYSMAFQQSYNEDEGIAEWKVVDYEFAGETPYY